MRLALLLAALPLAARAADDPLVGLWTAEIRSVPGPSGALTLERRGADWHVAIAGREASGRLDGRNLVLDLEDGAGFRAMVEGERIDAYWIQPPGDQLQTFASPLILTPAGVGRWRGTVRPLEDRDTLYLDIEPGSDGALQAVLRNPERNATGGTAPHAVERVDGIVRLTRANGARIDAALAGDRLDLDWPDLGRAVSLHRASAAEAAGFFTRPKDAPPYAYRRPPETGDGWTTARAGDAGMDEVALAKLAQRLAEADPAAARPALIQGLLIAHGGKLVLDEYFFGFDRDRPHDLRSAGKSLASVMVGTAMRQGRAIGPESRIGNFFAGPFANPDPRKAAITLGDLMTHRSGLACDDNDDASPGNEATMQDQKAVADWWRYTLDLPQIHDPGSRYAYCSAGMNLVGGALTAATGTWLPAYFDRAVARPLQWSGWSWNLMPNGEGYLGGGIYAQPRDLLKLGQAYLDGGLWRGVRILDPGWIARSTAIQAEVSPATTGLDEGAFHDSYIEGADGFAWHLSTLDVNGHRYREFAATGNGGQILSVVPELDLAVVFTAGNYGQGGIWTRFRSEMLPNEIAAAVKDPGR